MVPECPLLRVSGACSTHLVRRRVGWFVKVDKSVFDVFSDRSSQRGAA